MAFSVDNSTKIATLDGVEYGPKDVMGTLVALTEAEATVLRDERATLPNELNLKLGRLRDRRNSLLAETDYLALSDQTLSSDMTTYRQNLRDLTNGLDTVEKVDNVTWPTKP